VPPIVGFFSPEIVEELESLWKINLNFKDVVHKRKAIEESKFDVLRRRRK
jgi:hypothetical protein